MMNDLPTAGDEPASMSREEMMAALFANMVAQQTNMTLMMLGKIPHPQTGQPVQDLEAAKVFIDQLEMLAAKTKGNLSKEEDRLLQQSLAGLRMAFVEALGPDDQMDLETAGLDPQAPPTAPTPVQPQKAGGSPEPDEASRKKFSKKY